MASTASKSQSAFDASLESLTLFEEQYEAVEVVSALLDQNYDDAGKLQSVVTVGFRIRGRGGIFTVQPLFEPQWQDQAFVLIGLKHAYVEGIYAGLASKDDLPSGPTGDVRAVRLGPPVAV